MMDQTNEILEYDGSFSGFLCCVHDVFSRKKMPQFVLPQEMVEDSLFSGVVIETDEGRAEAIWQRLRKRLSIAQLRFIKEGFFSLLENKEVYLLQAIELGLNVQSPFQAHTYHKGSGALYRAIRIMKREVAHYCGFVRFNEVNGDLIAVIAPRHKVLPWLLPYFVKRYKRTPFAIYDQTHHLLGVSRNGKFSIEHVVLDTDFLLSDDELQIQNQWKLFFKAVSIEERKNERAQMSSMPKRYWAHLTEMQE